MKKCLFLGCLCVLFFLSCENITNTEVHPLAGFYVASVILPSPYPVTSVYISIYSNGKYSLDAQLLYAFLELKECKPFADTRDSSIKSLKQRYELGLIARSEYEEGVTNYNNKFDLDTAVIKAKYAARVFSGTLPKNSPYSIQMNNQSVNLSVNGLMLTIQDPISGYSYGFTLYVPF